MTTRPAHGAHRRTRRRGLLPVLLVVLAVLVGGVLTAVLTSHDPSPRAHASEPPVSPAPVSGPASVSASASAPGDPDPDASPQPAVVVPLVQAVDDHVVRRFHWASYIRQYRYHLPHGQVPTHPVPVIVVMHGYLLDDDWAQRSTGFNAVGDANDAIVIYPQGLSNSWNAGSCCGQAEKLGSDDVDFIHAVVADMARLFPVDLHRVVISGFSNGGMLAYQIACATPDQLAGVMIVSGSRQFEHCDMTAPVTIVALHSKGDRTVPLAGQRFSKILNTGTPSLNISLQPLLDEDACHSQHTAVTYPWTSTLYRQCAGGVDVTVIINDVLNHAWPKAQTLPGNRSAAAVAWTHFADKRSAVPFAPPKLAIEP